MVARRHPIPRSGKPIKRSTKPIPKVNARRQAKRKAGYRKVLSGKEYKAARAEAMKRADGMCEGTVDVLFRSHNGAGIAFVPQRCFALEDLHAHHLRYPKSRPLAASDLQILCKTCHTRAESRKLHKSRMF